MIKLGLCALTVFALFTEHALAQCYHKPGDMSETITDNDDGMLVWRHGKKKITFETSGAGTGLEYRLAFDKKGKGFRYEYQGGNLVFGGVNYEPGCK